VSFVPCEYPSKKLPRGSIFDGERENILLGKSPSGCPHMNSSDYTEVHSTRNQGYRTP
jgi:hypothetical protein